MATRNFLNLTNGLEWARDVRDFAFVRVESTAIEKRDWLTLFRDLDANFLLALARGDDCHFYDCGAGREVSKTVRVGVPAIRLLLTEVWLNGREMYAPDRERQRLKAKLNYFRRFLTPAGVRLTGHSRSTDRDGDRAYYRDLAGSADVYPLLDLTGNVYARNHAAATMDAKLYAANVAGEECRMHPDIANLTSREAPSVQEVP